MNVGGGVGGGGGGRGAGELSNHIFISLMTRIRGNKFRRKIVGWLLTYSKPFSTKNRIINEKSKQTQQAILHARNNLNFNAAVPG